MNQELKFTTKEILEKDFKTSMRGYNADEVDKFLDAIIQDYEVFNRKIKELEEENVHLKRDLKKASERQKQAPAQPVGSTNYDILQRLSNLEKAVFGNKL